jgi:hypothetical protein
MRSTNDRFDDEPRGDTIGSALTALDREMVAGRRLYVKLVGGQAPVN